VEASIVSHWRLYREFLRDPRSAQPEPGNLEDACANLVRLKDRFDEFMREREPFEGHFTDIWSSPPDVFMSCAFLRMRGWPQIAPDRVEEIPSHLVIGGRYRTYDPPDDPDRLMQDLNASGSGIVCRMGTLPLYYAIEGKNRVELFKRHRRALRATVRQMPFPAPGELVLQPDMFLNQAVWDGRGGGKALLFPEVTLPILRHHGLAAERRLPRLARSGYRLVLKVLFSARMRR
jgi:hypothetical protein